MEALGDVLNKTGPEQPLQALPPPSPPVADSSQIVPKSAKRSHAETVERKEEKKEDHISKDNGNKRAKKTSALSTPDRSDSKEAASSSQSTPEKLDKPSSNSRTNFGGLTQKANECWICGCTRDEYQKGSVCQECAALARKKLGHQRFRELCDQPHVLEDIKALSLEKQGLHDKSQKMNRAEKKLDSLLHRFEVALEQLPKLESLVNELQSVRQSLKASKRGKP